MTHFAKFLLFLFFYIHFSSFLILQYNRIQLLWMFKYHSYTFTSKLTKG